MTARRARAWLVFVLLCTTLVLFLLFVYPFACLLLLGSDICARHTGARKPTVATGILAVACLCVVPQRKLSAACSFAAPFGMFIVADYSLRH